MMTFSTIADAFLQELGLSPLQLETESAARSAATSWVPGKPYPVYYFKTDTSGEKGFEEFYTETEQLELSSFKQLGVIKNAASHSIAAVESTIDQLNEAFATPDVSKADVVKVISQLLPDFAHLETGRGLDQRM